MATLTPVYPKPPQYAMDWSIANASLEGADLRADAQYVQDCTEVAAGTLTTAQAIQRAAERALVLDREILNGNV